MPDWPDPLKDVSPDRVNEITAEFMRRIEDDLIQSLGIPPYWQGDDRHTGHRDEWPTFNLISIINTTV